MIKYLLHILYAKLFSSIHRQNQIITYHCLNTPNLQLIIWIIAFEKKAVCMCVCISVHGKAFGIVHVKYVTINLYIYVCVCLCVCVCVCVYV